MKLVPLEKQSKASQRAFHARQRGTWNGIVPVTRTVPDKTKYNRSQSKQALRKDAFDR